MAQYKVSSSAVQLFFVFCLGLWKQFPAFKVEASLANMKVVGLEALIREVATCASANRLALSIYHNASLMRHK